MCKREGQFGCASCNRTLHGPISRRGSLCNLNGRIGNVTRRHPETVPQIVLDDRAQCCRV